MAVFGDFGQLGTFDRTRKGCRVSRTTLEKTSSLAKTVVNVPVYMRTRKHLLDSLGVFNWSKEALN